MMYLTADDLPDLEEGQRILVESTGVNQMPDLGPEMDLYVSFESMLKTAEYLERDIEEMGGMSRSIAMEMYNVWPALAEKRPLAYYTAQPSQTLLTVAMEEIHLGIAAGIAAAVAALIAAIYKLWKWIRGGDKDKDGESLASNDVSTINTEAKKAEESVKVLEEVEHATQSLPPEAVKEVAEATEAKAVAHSKDVHNTHEVHLPVVDHRSSLVSAALHLASSRNMRLVDRFGTEEFMDLYHEGDWTKAVSEAAQAFKAKLPELEQRLKKLGEAADVDPTKLTDAQAHNIHELVSTQHTRSDVDEHFMTLAEHAEELHRKKRSETHKEAIELKEIGKRIQQLATSHQMHDLYELRSTILKLGAGFTSLENRLKPYADEATLKHVMDSDKHSETAKTIRHLTSEAMFMNKAVGTYYSMVVHYIAAVKQYSINYNLLVGVIEKTVIDDVEHISHQVKSDADKEKAKGVVAKLKQYLSRKK